MRTYKDKLLDILNQLEGFNASDEAKFKKLQGLRQANSGVIMSASPEIKLELNYKFDDLMVKYHGQS
jgi:hypothetical protein